MFHLLSRYVKKIEIYGIGIELREIPEPTTESVPVPDLHQLTPPANRLEIDPAAQSDTEEGIIELVQYLRVAGVSASFQRKPRELDLTLLGEEIQFHIHDLGKSRPKLWVKRSELQDTLSRWNASDQNEPIRVPARKARSESEVVFVVGEEDEMEVQAYWWIWVTKSVLKAALKEIDIRAPW